ncbi:hypothetical protein MRV_0072 [Murid herpesvirus 3]|uniref:Uncharacterized protein n=2 Tax=Murid betaherpesvirus 3 TaxID=2560603 RepID=A0A1P8VIV4_9BETA|nr:hypothetical protein MRV_0072 [Murine roseolovirus]APZ76283.1 hypothetical protein MRV_0072 [Murid betaherpesvirus 3]AYH64801.1 hypothetical protein MRV_0072 [Murid herpesvirus 3]
MSKLKSYFLPLSFTFKTRSFSDSSIILNLSTIHLIVSPYTHTVPHLLPIPHIETCLKKFISSILFKFLLDKENAGKKALKHSNKGFGRKLLFGPRAINCDFFDISDIIVINLLESIFPIQNNPFFKSNKFKI